MPHALDHNANTYVAVTLSPGSPYLAQPTSLAKHQALHYVGPVGELADVQLVAIPKVEWSSRGADVLGWLKGREGVAGVHVQTLPRTTAKRGGDEL
jgi:hypothetical protein